MYVCVVYIALTWDICFVIVIILILCAELFVPLI